MQHEIITCLAHKSVGTMLVCLLTDILMIEGCLASSPSGLSFSRTLFDSWKKVWESVFQQCVKLAEPSVPTIGTNCRKWLVKNSQPSVLTEPTVIYWLYCYFTNPSVSCLYLVIAYSLNLDFFTCAKRQVYMSSMFLFLCHFSNDLIRPSHKREHGEKGACPCTRESREEEQHLIRLHSHIPSLLFLMTQNQIVMGSQRNELVNSKLCFCAGTIARLTS